MRILAALSLALAPGLAVADELDGLLRDVRSPKARAAWDRLATQGSDALPRILAAMDTADTPTANWLRLAFDAVADRHHDTLDPAALLPFVRDAKRQGRARRVALDVVERRRPGSRDKLLTGWLDDPEFRRDAIDLALTRLDADKEKAIISLRKLFIASRDLDQSQSLAAKLKERGVAVSVADHLGFVREWMLLGPLDGHGKKGFRTAYPPESKVDLASEVSGKGGKKVRWQRFTAPESNAGRFPVLVNLRGPLGDNEDAVAFAYTAFEVPAAQTVTFLGSADDNMAVWVNGSKAFAFEEYHNGVRLDRHRFTAKLKAGLNTVLVKVCQAPVEPDQALPNWEFLLRVTDAAGKGLTFPPAPSMR